MGLIYSYFYIFYSSANIACFCKTECKFIVRFMLNYRVKTVLINKKVKLEALSPKSNLISIYLRNSYYQYCTYPAKISKITLKVTTHIHGVLQWVQR